MPITSSVRAEYPTSIKSRVAPRRKKMRINVRGMEFVTEAAEKQKKGETFMVKFPMFNDKNTYGRTDKGVFRIDETDQKKFVQ